MDLLGPGELRQSELPHGRRAVPARLDHPLTRVGRRVRILGRRGGMKVCPVRHHQQVVHLCLAPPAHRVPGSGQRGGRVKVTNIVLGI